MVEPPSCALCRRRVEAPVAVSQRSFCVGCLAAVGRFLLEGPHPVVESIWRARPRELARRALSDIVDDEILKIRQVAPSDDPAVEPVIATFKAAFTPDPKAPSPKQDDSDPVAHLDLAIGYREMGLTDDALGEAAIALSGAGHLGDRAQEAAQIVFNPGCLRGRLDESLVSLRSVLFPD